MSKEPKYILPAIEASGEITAAINNDVQHGKREGNKQAVLDAYYEFGKVSANVLYTTRHGWRDKAHRRVGQLGMASTVEITDANDAGLIQPPLTDTEINLLSSQRNLYSSLSELGKSFNSDGPTPTDAIDTDTPKAS